MNTLIEIIDDTKLILGKRKAELKTAEGFEHTEIKVDYDLASIEWAIKLLDDLSEEKIKKAFVRALNDINENFIFLITDYTGVLEEYRSAVCERDKEITIGKINIINFMRRDFEAACKTILEMDEIEEQ